MQILISCAKTMADSCTLHTPITTHPLFEEEANRLALQMADLTLEELEKGLKVNRQIAVENQVRYRHFHNEDTPSIPALLTYTGIVFKRIHPEDFTEADFLFAQEHLNITSFLYGLLRPLDTIRNYRLEGDVVLPDNNGLTMFGYWQSRLTDGFIEKIKADDGILVNLASDEMKRLFDWKRLCKEVRVITPEFKVYKGDKLRTIVIYTKMCRGEMTRHLLKQHLSHPDDIKHFQWEGFQWNESESKGDKWMFTGEV